MPARTKAAKASASAEASRNRSRRSSARPNEQQAVGGCRDPLCGKRKRPSGDDEISSEESDLDEEADHRKRDHTYCYNPRSARMPHSKDFSRKYGSLDKNNYVWGPPTAVQNFPPLVPRRAKKPAIPDPYEDGPDFDTCSDEEVQGPFAKKRKIKTSRRRHRAVRRNQTPPDEGAEAVVAAQREVQAEKKTLLITLPPEIRLKILRELLVADAPFNVYAGWKKVYKRDKPLVHLNILQVHSKTYHDGLSILYGENAFLYRLRDAPQTAVIDIERLAHADDPDSSSEDSVMDSDWEEKPGKEDDDVEEEYVVPRRRGRRNQATKVQYNSDNEINVEKFLPYFRHVIVEAEHNRFGQDTQEAMAKAIAMFTAPQGTRRINEKAPGIHTFTIRVTPRWTDDGFTFVDFFEATSPVIQTLKKVELQYLHIDLLTKYLTSLPDKTGSRISLDMRHYRFARRAAARLPDFWADDKMMQNARRKKAIETGKVLKKLQQHVVDRCKVHQPEETEEELASLMFGDWVELADVDNWVSNVVETIEDEEGDDDVEMIEDGDGAGDGGDEASAAIEEVHGAVDAHQAEDAADETQDHDMDEGDNLIAENAEQTEIGPTHEVDEQDPQLEGNAESGTEQDAVEARRSELNPVQQDTEEQVSQGLDVEGGQHQGVVEQPVGSDKGSPQPPAAGSSPANEPSHGEDHDMTEASGAVEGAVTGDAQTQRDGEQPAQFTNSVGDHPDTEMAEASDAQSAGLDGLAAVAKFLVDNDGGVHIQGVDTAGEGGNVALTG